ncbi:hypothetical protein DAI22_04g090350 [Oryza sativa Japonica Group]|nr:hypothetical protein DAI22_04g090350 [Oryza sativa Japonica Group]
MPTKINRLFMTAFDCAVTPTRASTIGCSGRDPSRHASTSHGAVNMILHAIRIARARFPRTRI